MLDVRYVAGLFDDEGSVTIRVKEQPDCLSPIHLLHANLSSTYRPILDLLAADFGGKINRTGRGEPRSKPAWNWRLHSRDALAFLEAVRPHLQIKAREVDIAIAFQSGIARTGRPLAEAEIARREGLRRELLASPTRRRINA